MFTLEFHLQGILSGICKYSKIQINPKNFWSQPSCKRDSQLEVLGKMSHSFLSEFYKLRCLHSTNFSLAFASSITERYIVERPHSGSWAGHGLLKENSIPHTGEQAWYTGPWVPSWAQTIPQNISKHLRPQWGKTEWQHFATTSKHRQRAASGWWVLTAERWSSLTFIVN
jgi:hypothetical protein